MKILFWGGGKGNNGPTNVSNCYRAALTENFVLVKSRHKYGEFIEAVWKLLRCDCVVVSGVSRKGALLVGFARIFRKKSAYIMHGCAEYECEINKTQSNWQGLAQEQYLLKHSTLLLPVSQKYMYWVQARYPRYAHRTKYLHNGIEVDLLPKNKTTNKFPGSVIAAGGSSRLKCNHIVAKAVAELGEKTRLEVYGGLGVGAENSQNVQYLGRVPNEVFQQKLAQSQLFVLNSLVESFSVATIEALMCGCSILVSEVAGVTDLLTLEETDIIHNPMDVEEIRSKIEYLLAHPNNERIRAKLDLEEYTYPRQVEKLEQLCRELVEQ